MDYKLLILAPSAGGKSTLMRYLREHTHFNIAEMDEEVMKENDNVWPSDNDHKDNVIVPRVVKNIISKKQVIYLASYVPTDLIKKAKSVGFKIILLDIDEQELQKRNKERMREESYEDASQWFELQFDNYKKLQAEGLVDIVLDGTQTPTEITERITSIAKSAE